MAGIGLIGPIRPIFTECMSQKKLALRSFAYSMRHFMSIFPPVCPVLLVFALVGLGRAATVVTIQHDSTVASGGDAFVTTGPTNNLTANNYGAAGGIAVSSAGLSKGEFKSALRFDTAAAFSTLNGVYGSGGWVIDSIQLQLTVAAPNNAIFNSPNAAGTFMVEWLQSDAWTEGTGTPSASSLTGISWTALAALISSGTQSAGSFSYLGDATGTTLQFTLTPPAGLSNDVLSGTQASLLLSGVTPGMTATFNARNNGVQSTRPALIISASAVPEPGRAGLLILGAMIVSFRHRRRA